MKPYVEVPKIAKRDEKVNAYKPPHKRNEETEEGWPKVGEGQLELFPEARNREAESRPSYNDFRK